MSSATPRKTKPLTAVDIERAFSQGYYCAVANIMRTYKDDVIARHVLWAMGDNPKRADILPEDAKELRRYRLFGPRRKDLPETNRQAQRVAIERALQSENTTITTP